LAQFGVQNIRLLIVGGLEWLIHRIDCSFFVVHNPNIRRLVGEVLIEHHKGLDSSLLAIGFVMHKSANFNKPPGLVALN
jgi:hypothetical protein